MGVEGWGNYGVKTKIPSPGIDLTCVGPGPGFVYLGIWLNANGGHDNSWVEIGYSDCDEWALGPVWVWAEMNRGSFQQHVLGSAAYLQTNTYKVYSHFDGSYRVYINGAQLGTALNFDKTNYLANDAEAGLEVVNHYNSILKSTSHLQLKAWLYRNTRTDWDGTDYCAFTEPLGGKWIQVDRWRVDLNQNNQNSQCP